MNCFSPHTSNRWLSWRNISLVVVSVAIQSQHARSLQPTSSASQALDHSVSGRVAKGTQARRQGTSDFCSCLLSMCSEKGGVGEELSRLSWRLLCVGWTCTVSSFMACCILFESWVLHTVFLVLWEPCLGELKASWLCCDLEICFTLLVLVMTGL